MYIGILMEVPLFLTYRQFKALEEQQKTRGERIQDAVPRNETASRARTGRRWILP
jgi:hypothetical protein